MEKGPITSLEQLHIKRVNRLYQRVRVTIALRQEKQRKALHQPIRSS